MKKQLKMNKLERRNSPQRALQAQASPECPLTIKIDDKKRELMNDKQKELERASVRMEKSVLLLSSQVATSRLRPSQTIKAKSEI